LQLILQEQVDGFMEEEIINVDDDANRLKWVFDVERKRQTMFESINCEEIPVLLQIRETEGGDIHNNSNDKLTSSDSEDMNTRCKEIY
jgi:hypothetical protein